jgi:ribosomal protein S18 acetylase RimI-like enzyme
LLSESTVSDLLIRPLIPSEGIWVARHVAEQWGSEIVVAHGALYRPAALPGFVAEADGEAVGLLTYHIEGDACEIVTLDSQREGRGIGAALIEAAKDVARQAGCRRLWLITTNDNTHALRFYQKQGFVLAALHRDAVATSRAIKPEIPMIGNDGIPIRDEIELEMLLIE